LIILREYGKVALIITEKQTELNQEPEILSCLQIEHLIKFIVKNRLGKLMRSKMAIT